MKTVVVYRAWYYILLGVAGVSFATAVFVGWCFLNVSVEHTSPFSQPLIEALYLRDQTMALQTALFNALEELESLDCTPEQHEQLLMRLRISIDVIELFFRATNEHLKIMDGLVQTAEGYNRVVDLHQAHHTRAVAQHLRRVVC